MPPLFGALGPTTLFVIIAVGIVLFGRKLPEIGRLLGLSVVEFKRGLKGEEAEPAVASVHTPCACPPTALSGTKTLDRN